MMPPGQDPAGKHKVAFTRKDMNSVFLPFLKMLGFVDKTELLEVSLEFMYGLR